MDFQNPEVLKEECKEGREFGFTGKQAIHPAQIDVIQEMYLPDPVGKHLFVTVDINNYPRYINMTYLCV